jgi:glycosyltransferase involved in cell wall biosynthesis
VAIKAIRHLLDHFSVEPQEIRYRLIGYGPLENEMREWIRQYNLENVAELVIRPSDLDDHYRNADIYLCASTFEGISNSVLEALSFGLPMVATDVGDNRKLVSDGKSGFIVPVGNYEAMARCLHQLICSPAKRLEFGEKGYHLCRENYSTEAFRNAYLAFLDSLENKEHHA